MYKCFDCVEKRKSYKHALNDEHTNKCDILSRRRVGDVNIFNHNFYNCAVTHL